MNSRNLLLISNDQTLIEIFQQLEGFELAVSPYNWYVESTDKNFDVAIVDADFARMTRNIDEAVSNATVAFAIISPGALKDFLSKNRTEFFDIWVHPVYAELLPERIRKGLEYETLIKPNKEVLAYYAYEINGPLVSIRGYLDVIFSGMVGELEEQQKQLLSAIKSNANDIRVILQRFRDKAMVGGPELIHPQAINLTDIIPSELKIHDKQLSKQGINIALAFPEHPLFVLSHEHSIRWFFVCLLDLFLSCLKVDANVSISFDVKENELTCIIKTPYLEFLKTDSRQKLTTILPTTQAHTADGTQLYNNWLALSGMYAYLYQIGSDIFIESDLGKGTTFYFTLPIAKDEIPK